jgi:hypothetical protein
MKLRINTKGVSFTCTRAPEPRTSFESGQPRIDKATGLPLWLVQVMALDSDGGDVIAVSGLVAVPWSQDGRSGVAYRADAITAGDSATATAKAPGLQGRS